MQVDGKHTVSRILLLAVFFFSSSFLAFSCHISAKTVHLAPQNGITSVTAALANEPHYSLIIGKASSLYELHHDGKLTILACERVQLPN